MSKERTYFAPLIMLHMQHFVASMMMSSLVLKTRRIDPVIANYLHKQKRLRLNF